MGTNGSGQKRTANKEKPESLQLRQGVNCSSIGKDHTIDYGNRKTPQFFSGLAGQTARQRCPELTNPDEAEAHRVRVRGNRRPENFEAVLPRQVHP